MSEEILYRLAFAAIAVFVLFVFAWRITATRNNPPPPPPGWPPQI